MRIAVRSTVLIALAAATFCLSPAGEVFFSPEPPMPERRMPEEYEAMWKEVDDALDKGLPKTALEIVQRIYAKAKQEKNNPQIIKSAAYRVALLAQTNENGETILVQDIEKEIASARQPVKAIFQSMLADVYWGYYQMNRWRIGQRTQTADAPEQDFRTWDASKFFDTTRALYLESIAPAAELKKIPVKEYEYILVRQQNSELYRPTLYDILAHRALDFFSNDETDLPKPEQEFELTTLDALAPAAEFTAHTFATPDPADPIHTAVVLYQDLLRFHAGDREPDARVDLDLQRLAFSRRKTFHEDTDTAYYQALTSLHAASAQAPISTLVGHAIAKYHHENGDYIRAKEVCERERKRYPDSRGAVDCASLIAQIEFKSIEFSVEQTVLPDAPFIVSAGYRNLRTVHCRILRWDEGTDGEDFSYRGYRSIKEWLSEVVRRKPVKEWTAELPATTDYKEHRVDLKGPAFERGRYLLLVSAERGFAIENNAIDYAFLSVTRLSLQTQQRHDGEYACWVQDAENGRPLAGVTVELSGRRWNSSSDRYERHAIRTLTTGADGMFTVRQEKDRGDVWIRLSLKGDEYAVSQPIYPYARGKSSESYRTIFFTDRSLYRPGQTIFFKGIVIKQHPEAYEYAVAKHEKTSVRFIDVNRQQVAEQTFTTSEYGTFNGSFTAPSGVLTGVMTIHDAWGNTTIRVEEYKRPKFEVAFEPVTGAFRLNEEITTKGTAKAYAGSNIDGAEVRYRVVRRARYPYWWWWWRPAPGSDDKEIAHGTARTDEKGEFEVRFTAVPDKSVDKKDLPVFTYTVTADVTDINGETHSASTAVSVAYTAIQLSAEIGGMIDRSDKTALEVKAANTNGSPARAAGKIVVERLTPPRTVFRARFLPAPDQFDLKKSEFTDAFPHDVYKEENNEDTWPVDRIALSASFSTGEQGGDSIALPALAPGRYRATVTAKDPSGEDLTVKRFFTVYDRRGTAPPSTTPALVVPLKTSCLPGDTAAVLYATSFAGARVLYQVENRGVMLREEWITLDNTQRRFELRIGEDMRGGLTMRFSLVRDYRLYFEEVYITVPWSNKALVIETATFRDKLKPGQQEEWRLTVKGEHAEPVAAEMVAAMYDASLDAIWRRWWSGFSWPWAGRGARIGEMSFGAVAAQRYVHEDWNVQPGGYSQYYDNLDLFLLGHAGAYGRGGYFMMKSGAMDMAAAPSAARIVMNDRALVSEGEMAKEEKRSKDGRENAPDEAPAAEEGEAGQVQARKNLNETAFFFPTLMTNDRGEIVLSFTVPEALTRWRLQAFAHTPDLKVGSIERTTVTQKELMVMPNAPRFLREGDEIVFPAKITNLSDTALTGTAKLQLFDAVSMQPVDDAFGLRDAGVSFSVEKGLSTSVRWRITVPQGIGAIVYRVVAKAGAFSDGEEAPLPVLPNRMLVTETLPLYVRGKQTRTFTLDKLLNAGSSSTLRHQNLTLEMTSNPAWYAVQALPYMMEFPYECSEQVFNRFYANSIATHVANSNPKIKRVFEQWKGTDALLSNLEKNQDLKSVLLQETPWVLQAQSETERKKRVGLLFDLNRMANSLDEALRKLERAQSGNGGWPWFPGMPESRYITQYILAGLGHLRELGVRGDDARIRRITDAALRYADEHMQRDYEELKRIHRTLNHADDYLGYLEIQYLYCRGYFPERKIDSAHREAVDFWLEQARRHWLAKGLMAEGMIALGLHRFEDAKTPKAILRSLTERALNSDELGMYWKQAGGWYWYQAPIETQALLVEAYDVIKNDKNTVEELKIWLLKQKQVQDWKTTIATAEACYALLRRGTDLLASDKLVEVVMGGTTVDPRRDGGSVEAGTGYYRVSWTRGEITPKLGTVKLAKSDDGIAWGGVYWQYYEQLDKITPHASPLRVDKKLYRQNTTGKGVMLEPITEKNPLRVGDILKARIEIRVDRDMEYVHMKDMRGAGLEPINQLSTCKWQGGLCYYEAPKDASVNFFFHWLPKGVYVFEYALRVAHEGAFSNGITTIQSMYAPEFAGHTQGVNITVK